MRLAPSLPPHSASRGPIDTRRWASGIASLDAALGGGFARGRVHEVYGAEAEDAAAAAGFVAVVAAGMGRAASGTVLWLRMRRAAGLLQANGWSDLGGGAGQGLVGTVPDAMALLRAAVEGLRCAALGAVIVEGWGPLRELDLTASRRFALAAERSGVPLFLLRIEATPVPSAAQTRWQVASAPSRALPGHAPGWPSFDIALLRQRSGRSGLDWRVEWDRDQGQFREAPLSGAVVPVPVRRPAADGAVVPRRNFPSAA